VRENSIKEQYGDTAYGKGQERGNSKLISKRKNTHGGIEADTSG
jgi:hypothetical protein